MSLLLFCATTYLFATMTEWVLHKYVLHANSGLMYDFMGREHIAHHMDTKEDMTLKSGPENYEGIRIPYKDTILTMLIFNPAVWGINVLTQANLPLIYLVLVGVGLPLFHNFSWNCIHMKSHHITNHSYTDGIPLSTRYPPDIIYNYLAWYHTMHHVKKGCNYNVVFPGADWLMGTYRSK